MSDLKTGDRVQVAMIWLRTTLYNRCQVLVTEYFEQKL